MALTQTINYTTGTVISADNLNDIQDNINKYCVPEYTSANDGNFLRIVGNQMQWVAIIAAEDVSF